MAHHHRGDGQIDLEERLGGNVKFLAVDLVKQGVVAAKAEVLAIGTGVSSGDGQLEGQVGRDLILAFENDHLLTGAVFAYYHALDASVGFEFDLREELIQFFRYEQAMVDRECFDGASFFETERELFRVVCWRGMKLHLVAVGKGDWAGCDFDFRLFREFADALELVLQELFFERKLMRIADVLVVAAAALGEVLARWLDALRRALYQLDQFAAGVALFAFCQLNFGGFAGEDEGDEDGATVGQAAHTIPAIDHFFEVDCVDLFHFL